MSNCNHDRLALQLCCSGCGEEIETREVSRAEMEAQAVDLPDREAMSLVNANIAVPVNAAVAANVLSDGATAYANAAQNTPIQQGI